MSRALGRLAIFAGVGVLMAQAATAVAADMPGTLPPPSIAYPPATEWRHPQVYNLNYGWYLRGDLAYRRSRIDGAEFGTASSPLTNNTLGSTFMGGVGVGIKSRWLRTDVTMDYSAPMKFEGRRFTADDSRARVSAFSALFNGYLDLGTWYRSTPYVGAGAGVAQVRVTDYDSPAGRGGANSQWNFAWAAMAGISYTVAPNMMVDVGYRYIGLGDVDTAPSPALSTTLKNLSAHEVRVGLRWSFDDLVVAQ